MRSIVIVPTYNERENIVGFIPAVLAALPDLDMLIVDDNSPDGTADLVAVLAAQNKRVRLMRRPGKQGLGSAYLAGFRYALSRAYTQIVVMDADFSHNPADLPRLIEPVRSEQADLVLGSRWAPGGGTVNWPVYRQLISRSGSLYARTILGLSIHDMTGGFKCFHRDVLSTLNLAGIRASGYGFHIELTYRAIRAGFRVREIPITFTERVAGQSKLSGGIITEALGLVWKMRLERLPQVDPQIAERSHEVRP